MAFLVIAEEHLAEYAEESTAYRDAFDGESEASVIGPPGSIGL